MIKTPMKNSNAKQSWRCQRVKFPAIVAKAKAAIKNRIRVIKIKVIKRRSKPIMVPSRIRIGGASQNKSVSVNVSKAIPH